MAKNLPKNLQTGLVLWLDGSVSGTTAYDVSGSGNNGTTVGSPTTQRTLQNKGFVFNGSSQYITIPTTTLNTSEFTLNAFVKVSAGGDDDTIFHFRNSETTSGWCMLSWSKGDGGRTVNSIYFAFYADDLNTTFALNTGEIYMITATYKANVQSIYINGILLASRTTLGNPAIPTSAIIGRRADTGSQYFLGNNYNSQVWNRALSPTEIQQLKNSLYIK